MNSDRERISEKLRQELEPLRFERAEQVLERTHPRTWKARLAALWNKELDIALVPAGVVLSVAAIALVAVWQLGQPDAGIDWNDAGNSDDRRSKLVEAGGNTYWKEDYERAVAKLEADDQHQG